MAELDTDFPHLSPDNPTQDLWRTPSRLCTWGRARER